MDKSQMAKIKFQINQPNDIQIPKLVRVCFFDPSVDGEICLNFII